MKLVEDPTAAVSRTLGLSWNIKADLNQAADGALSVRGSLRDVTIFNTRMNKGRAVGAQVRSLQSGHYIMQR